MRDMKALYVLNELSGKRASTEDFMTKQAAKLERNRLFDQGITSVVSRGPDHPHGPSRPDPSCRNTEPTSYKRRRREKLMV